MPISSVAGHSCCPSLQWHNTADAHLYSGRTQLLPISIVAEHSCCPSLQWQNTADAHLYSGRTQLMPISTVAGHSYCPSLKCQDTAEMCFKSELKFSFLCLVNFISKFSSSCFLLLPCHLQSLFTQFISLNNKTKGTVYLPKPQV